MIKSLKNSVCAIGVMFLMFFCLSALVSCKKSKNQIENGIDKSGAYSKIVKKTLKDNGKIRIFCPDLDVSPEATDKSGDCTVILSPDNQVLVLDCGHPDSFKYIYSLLNDLKITKIDYLVISHPHIDHLGGVPALCAVIPVEKCYYNGLEYPTQYFESFKHVMSSRKIPLEILKDGDSFMFGEKVKVDILWPEGDFVYPDGYPANSTQFVNDTSIALKLTFGSSTALFCGDLYRSAERELIEKHKNELSADVVKANHHGNDTSNSLSWIKAVNPKIVYAMNDVIGSMTVYQQYTKNPDVKFYHSKENGLIKITMGSKQNYNVQTQFESWMNK